MAMAEEKHISLRVRLDWDNLEYEEYDLCTDNKQPEKAMDVDCDSCSTCDRSRFAGQGLRERRGTPATESCRQYLEPGHESFAEGALSQV